MLAVRQLLPDATEIDPAGIHASYLRPPPPNRPWVMTNMIASVDGATAVDGVSGGLGGPADKAVFSAIRAVADVILVAAGTARAEDYGPPRTPEVRRAERTARGQTPYPRLVLVSRSLDLDPAAPMFTEAPERPIVFTCTEAPQDRRHLLATVAEVIDAGADGVDLARALDILRQRGTDVVLAEGGPGLNGQLAAAGLIDEVNLSTAPLLVGGGSARWVHGSTLPDPLLLDLGHLWEAGGLLFSRYVRA